MSGTNSDTPVGMQQEKDRKKAALEELLEKTRAEFEKSYAGVWDEASAEIRMTHQFDGLSADPDTARSGTNSEVETPEPKPVGIQVPDRAVGNKWKRTAAKGWTEGQSSASAASTENFALVTAPYSTMVELSSDEAPDAPPSLPPVTGYQAGCDGGGSQMGASSAAASSASSLPPVTGYPAGGGGGVLVIVGGPSSAASSSSPPVTGYQTGGDGPALTKKERLALAKSQQMEKRDMKELARPICDLPESWVKATWPKVDCTQCGFVDSWKRMENHLLNDS